MFAWKFYVIKIMLELTDFRNYKTNILLALIENYLRFFVIDFGFDALPLLSLPILEVQFLALPILVCCNSKFVEISTKN